jgi:hypothetical protein
MTAARQRRWLGPRLTDADFIGEFIRLRSATARARVGVNAASPTATQRFAVVG